MAEEMKEGTEFFTVRSKLPVVESFGFADGECSIRHLLALSDPLCARHH